MSKKNPEIKISFYLFGRRRERLDLGELTKRLGITPTETRTLDDWPEALKNPKFELSDDVRPRCVWEISLDYKECLIVSYRFDEIIDVLYGKENVINSLSKELYLETHFEVVIAAHHDRMPGMLLTKENIEFIASIGADVGFDMYLD